MTERVIVLREEDVEKLAQRIAVDMRERMLSKTFIPFLADDCDRIVSAIRAAAVQVPERKIDPKFSIRGGQIVKVSSGEIVPEWEPLMLQRARDHLMLPTLYYYRQLSELDGCNDYHLSLLDDRIAEFERFKVEHPEWMKQPSVTRGAVFTPAPVPDPAKTEPRDPSRHAPLIARREALAALAHEQWSGWMKYLIGRLTCGGLSMMSDRGPCVIERDDLDRWKRQVHTPYAELSESEKESDRKEADRVIALLTEYSPSMSAPLDAQALAEELWSELPELRRYQMPEDGIARLRAIIERAGRRA